MHVVSLKTEAGAQVVEILSLVWGVKEKILRNSQKHPLSLVCTDMIKQHILYQYLGCIVG